MIRTGYSFRTAVGHLSEVASRLKEIGWDAFPMTDRCSTFGYVEMTKAAKKAGLRPVYGVELGVVPQLGEKRPTVDYWKFIAAGSVRPVHDLIALATSNAGREPSLTYDQALAAVGVAKVSGERLQVDHVPRKAKNFWVGLSPATPRGLYRQAEKKGLAFCALPDNLFPRRGDQEFYRVAIGRWSTSQTYPQWIVSDEEWEAALTWVDPRVRSGAMIDRDRIVAASTAELVKAEIMAPPRKKTLRQMCSDGAKKLGVDLKDEVYSRRLDHELRMIADKKFEDYFYLLAELIGWAKERMVVGPARGSSCGSLACYLLGITTIDPLPHGLMFERFIDVTRADLPDVDVDFSDVRRHLVFEHAAKIYGHDHVARLGNVNSFQAKMALNQAAASLRIPSWRIEKVTASIIHRAMGDSRASQTIEDTLTATDVGRALIADHPEMAIVSRLEDHPSAASQHAAGVVITKRPVADHAAVDSRTGAVMADKKDAESLDLLKIDALGLTQLSIFERTMELIGRPVRSGWLETLPMDDPAAFAVLNEKRFAGVFQFVGSAVKSLSLALLRGDEFRDLSDIVAITALARPGPMGGGSADEWNLRRTKRADVTYPHPLFEPHLRDTYGVVIYQEQVMSIGREIGDLTWGEVSELRRAMSKSLGQEFFDKFGDKWKANAEKKGISKAVLRTTWEELCNFGAMAFNKSHSVAYGTVSYWCCWLKAHHPVEFAAATLDAESDPAKQITLLRELRDEGIDYVAVDPDRSEDRWLPADRDGRRMLVGPLTAIRGIGPAGVRDVIESRRTGAKLKPSLSKKLAAAETDIDSLFPVGDAVKRFSGGDLSSLKIATTPTPVSGIHGAGDDVVVIGVVTKIDPTNENDLLRVQKRNGKRVTGPEVALHMYVRDDSGDMFCKVHRLDYERVGKEIAERGRAGKAIYALKGNVFTNAEFSMLWVKQIKYLGELGQ